MLRQPKIDVPNTDFDNQTDWHTLKCELITPMYGGGVISTKVDEKMPIRASAIRGQLRFWWRLLAKHKWQLANIPKAETELWGGMNQGDSDGKASKVLLKVGNISQPKIEPWAEYEPNRNNKLNLNAKSWSNVSYALFPAQGKLQAGRTEIEEVPHSLLRKGFKWDLLIKFSDNISAEEKEQVWQAIRWWANFGGVGARTRRGLGAIEIKEQNYFDKVVSVDEINSLGFGIELKSAKDAYNAWEYAVKRLESFRQVGAGRKDHSSRSHWSEPDAIRKVTNQSIDKHSLRKTQGDIFPRAGFGLPIITKFKDNNANGTGTRTSVDPQTTTLLTQYTLDNGTTKTAERMTSPLILRPYVDKQGKWHSLALVLDEPLYEQVDGRAKYPLLLKFGNQEQMVKFWNSTDAQDIKPLKQNGDVVQKPLQAFLAYFKK